MQESGELPAPGTDPLTFTQGQRTAMTMARRLIVEGVSWTAVATRTPEGRRETNRAFRALARSQTEANAAYAVCSAIRVLDRMPPIAAPPAPVDGQEGCADEAAAFFAAVRACATLEALRAQAHAGQSKLEQGTLTCQSQDRARSLWAQIGSAAAGADSFGQRVRCGTQ